MPISFYSTPILQLEPLQMRRVGFILENVELGRIGLKVSYVGYEERVVSGILVTSGKELNLQISLQESINSLK
jgi:hypothetical protein